LHQYGLARDNRIVSIEPEKFTISYAISTLPGQSGSPVCIGDKVIAIHNGGGKEYEHFNVGRIITIDLLMTL
jgi:V8-like Glu-specific endopeptidase